MDGTDSKANPGVHLVNAANQHPRTLIVLGVPRGGTTMVAGALLRLGIYMGEPGGRANLEDIPLSDAVEGRDIESVRHILRERDDRFEVWGWKRPSSRNFLTLIQTEFRNPHFVMMWRDPFVSAQRRAIATGHDVGKTMQAICRAQGRLIDFARTTSLPLIMLSYEKFVRRPDLSIEALADFAGVKPTQEAVEFVSPDSNPYVDRLSESSPAARRTYGGSVL